ncbi:hypothetical protein T10_6837 [Trichinella papuae]|uniref:Uncharacterized protein n=1 Tax=Trichinella papuae TaxID=268474 RepID=A0A0V1MYH2_9BILA|nr:hypothetical protein T10_6837 [Trichinella papuae]
MQCIEQRNRIKKMHCQLVDQKIHFTSTKSGKSSNYFTRPMLYNSILAKIKLGSIVWPRFEKR